MWPIDHSLPGWAYRTSSLRVAEADDGGMAVWLPLQDGIERVGVLGLSCDRLDAALLRFCRSLAALLTLIVLTKGAHSDSYTRVQRARPMDLPAELVWAFLPPRTLRAPEVTSSAVLEPAYQVGGDAFDHTLFDRTLHAAVLDAMGHDLPAGLTSSVALAGCRNARRTGAGLSHLTTLVDHAIADAFPDRYCTGVFLHLDLESGELTWTNCGHPPPLLIRGHRILPDALERPVQLPLGLARLSGQVPTVHHEQLRPGDRVLLYTDGVTDARPGRDPVRPGDLHRVPDPRDRRGRARLRGPAPADARDPGAPRPPAHRRRDDPAGGVASPHDPEPTVPGLL
ncbi:PP2C family protein-serine/threonine phosphatase [Streptomyces zhihengii]